MDEQVETPGILDDVVRDLCDALDRLHRLYAELDRLGPMPTEDAGNDVG